MSPVDFLASAPHFIDHMAPVYLALPEQDRGDFLITPGKPANQSGDSLMARAARRGIIATSTAADPSRPIVVSAWADHKRARSLGRTRIARMEHGYGQSYSDTHPSYAGGAGCEDVGLFLVPNHHSGDRWRAAYPDARVEVVGCPKLDELPHRGPGRRPVIAVSFHWGIGVASSGPRVEAQGSFAEYRLAVRSLSRTHHVIGHGHPRALAFLGRYWRRFGIPVVEDFADVCRQADLYVCDTSSTLFEFASTGRPVVVVNGSHFRRDVSHGLRYWDAATVGVQCDRPEDLRRTVDRALDDTPEQAAAREAALDLVYAYRTGAAERAAGALRSWARSQTVRAVA